MQLSHIATSLALAANVVCMNQVAVDALDPFLEERSENAEEKLKRGLEKTANEFLVLLESGDPVDFSAVISRKGVVFGIEPPPISFRETQKQIKQKEGVYCLLFASECLRREEEEFWKSRNREPPRRANPL